MPFVVFLAIVLIITVFLGYNAGRNEEKEALQKIRSSFGKAGGRVLNEGKKRRIREFYDSLSSPGDIDDITWEDLKLDHIYGLINHSESSAGDSALYLRLRRGGVSGSASGDGSGSPADAGTSGRCESVLDHRISPAVWLEDREKAFRFLLSARKLGYMRNGSLNGFLRSLDSDTGIRIFRYAFLDLLMIASFILMLFVPSYGVLLFLGSVFAAVVHGSLSHRDLSPYLSGMSFVRRLRDCLREVLDILPSEYAGEREAVTSFISKSAGFYRTSSLLGSGDGSLSFGALEVVMSYVRLITGIDVFAFSGAVRELKKIRDEVTEAFIIFGKAESDVSAASFREYLGGGGCEPVFTESSGLAIKGLYHPALEKPVKNDIDAKGCVLVTGANASGKSTFLRACAISVLLAQTMGTVPADSYTGQRFRIMSSMTVSDDLLRGDSYYVAEVKAIKRILDATAEGPDRACAASENSPADAAGSSGSPRVLCFLDEVLRGTNTPERISAGHAILRALSERGALTFAATHDLELTQLLSDIYENYYFSEKTEADSFDFDYVIRKGVSKDTNAIKLLVSMGFDSEITDKAIDMAVGFMKNGVSVPGRT